jgi:hypothetical protein
MSHVIKKWLVRKVEKGCGGCGVDELIAEIIS